MTSMLFENNDQKSDYCLKKKILNFLPGRQSPRQSRFSENETFLNIHLFPKQTCDIVYDCLQA